MHNATDYHITTLHHRGTVMLYKMFDMNYTCLEPVTAIPLVHQWPVACGRLGAVAAWLYIAYIHQHMC
jgi:hypothetical protein